MIGFLLKYLDGNIYLNTTASTLSDIAAYICGGIIYKYLKVRATFGLGFLIGLIGGLLIVFFGDKEKRLMPIFLIFAKFGISINFFLCYVATVKLFPTLFVATAFGFIGLFSNILTILAPFVAEVNEPTPMLIYSALCFGGMILSLFIIDEKKP